MEITVKNLINRKGNYYFRCRLPNYAGEIKVSLKTRDLKKAVNSCRLATERLNAILSGAWQMIPLQEIRRMIAESLIRVNLEDREALLASYGVLCPGTRKDGANTMLQLSNFIETALLNNDLSAMNATVSAEELLRNAPHDTLDIQRTAREYLRAQLYLARTRREELEGKRFSTVYNETDFNEVLNGNYRTAAEIIEAEKVLTLGDLAKRYLAEKSEAWGASMRESVKSVLDTFIEYFSGDTDIKAIKHQNLLDYRDNVLLKLPVRRSNHQRLKNLPLADLLKEYKGETLSKKTVNLMSAKIGSFFIWCFDHEYIDRNPANKLQLKLGHKANMERSPYSTDDLKLLFTNLREDTLNNWKIHKLWIPLIALYSGARQNEICQLQLENIFNAGGIPCFEITETGDEHASLKNKGSKRVVPIHPVLLQLGFLNYVLDRRKSKRTKQPGANRLWFTLEYKEKYGYAHDFQKFFGRFNRKNVTADEKKVFHSFRHNFTNNLKQQGVQESMVAELVGHTVNSMTFSRYGKDFNPAILLENIKKLDHGFDMFEILGKTPLDDKKIAELVEQLPKR
ncbi:MAG TPA: hypothetical protein DE060_07755 [Lentisphaeria bacterium]|nr:hypothetical protein [Lentisphaeria bacterium]HCG49084.1 hypothetical protein [Lentisphaeria bacterium]